MPDYESLATKYKVSSRTVRRWESEAGIDIENPAAVAKHLATQRTASPSVLAATMNALTPGEEKARKMIQARTAEIEAKIQVERLRNARLKSQLAIARNKIATAKANVSQAPVSATPLADAMAKLEGAERSSFYQSNETAIKRERLLARHPNTITTVMKTPQATTTAASFATAPLIMARAEFEKLSHSDRARFFKTGGKLI
jgi:septal ring factor EnvC (AmiA/AmiB activator)